MTDTAFKGEVNLDAWLDRHHVKRVRTLATDLDGYALGKYCAREKFTKGLPIGHNLADAALGSDSESTPHLGFWHTFRRSVLGDIALSPDLSTLVPDGKDPDLGQVICDFTFLDGRPISLCPRTKLKQQVEKLDALGLSVKCTFELEFFLFDNSFDDAERKRYQNLSPVGASPLQTIYLLKDSFRAVSFMNEVLKRLEWFGIPWEAWNDENGMGQIELNLMPDEPVVMADRVVRAKQIIFETAVEQGLSTTFMAHLVFRTACTFIIHCSAMAVRNFLMKPPPEIARSYYGIGLRAWLRPCRPLSVTCVPRSTPSGACGSSPRHRSQQPGAKRINQRVFG